MAFPSYTSTPVGAIGGSVQDPGTGAALPVNTNMPVALDKIGALEVADMGGRFRSMSHFKHVYGAAVTSAAQAIAVNTTTSGAVFTLVNPIGSGILVEPIDFQLDFLDTNAAPATANVVGFSFVNINSNAISGITKIPVPTGGGGVNAGSYAGFLGAPNGTAYVATVITYGSALTVAANWGYPMFSFPASWVPTVGGFPVPLTHTFKGKILLPAGYAMSLLASTAWGSNTVIPSIWWSETPA